MADNNKNSVFSFPVDYAKIDFNELEAAFRNYFGSTNPNSPFKDYNFDGAGLKNIAKIHVYMMHYLGMLLNMGLSEVYLSKAQKAESIYSLIKNFNYVPFGKSPAQKNLLIRVFRGWTSAQNSGDDNKKFAVQFTYLDYTSQYQAIASFRDKYMESKYTMSSLDIDNENKTEFYLEPYIDPTTGKRYLQAKIPMIQAGWKKIELNNVANLTSPDGTQEIYFTDDGTKNNTILSKEKVLFDSIRVFVKENGASTYIEYTDIEKRKNLDNNFRQFKIQYSPYYGLYLKFNINGFSRQLSVGDTIRVIYARTEGDEINELSGTKEFGYSKTNLNKVGFLQVNDLNVTPAVTVLNLEKSGTTYSITSSFYNQDGTTNTNKGYYNDNAGASYDGVTLSIIDEDGNVVGLDNGQAKQTLSSIKEIAPYYFAAYGRAVVDNDFYPQIKAKFSEYRDVVSWSGESEFIDILQIINDVHQLYPNVTQIFPPNLEIPHQYTIADFVSAMQQVRNRITKDGIPAVDNIYYADIELGNYERDKGFIYYSIMGNSFDFETNSSNIAVIENYMAEFKMSSLYFKYKYPSYLLLVPNIVLKIKKTYFSSLTTREIKQRVFDYINNSSFYFKKSFSAIDMRDDVSNYDEVESVVDITLSYKLKFRPNPQATIIQLAHVTNFVAGDTITGSTTGSTALIQTINTTTNELKITNLTGDFKVYETIIGAANGAAACTNYTPAAYTVLRFFNIMVGDIGSAGTFNAIDNNATLWSIYTQNGQVYIKKNGGNLVTNSAWKFNQGLSMLRFKYDFEGAEYIYIENLPLDLTSGKLNSSKEVVIGIENIENIGVVFV